MSSDTELVTETIEEPEPEQTPEPETPTSPYRTLLEIWQHLLRPAREGVLRNEPVTPQWATKIVSTYQGVSYADTPAVSTGMYDVIDSLGNILDEVISSGEDPFTPQSADEDREQNSKLYLDLITKWQAHLLTQELRWSPTVPDAAVQLAALSEVHQMFFGQTGLAAHLDNIKFEFTEDSQQQLQQTLQTTRDEILSGSHG